MTKSVLFQGSASKATAFSVINHHWQKQLAAAGYRIITDPDPTEIPDIYIHHDYEQYFGEVISPAAGKRIAVRTWDFGPFPPSWVEKINQQFDQLWIHSEWTRTQAVKSGIPPSNIQVIPHGFDPDDFRPDGTAYPDISGGFKFLFVGAAVPRKGIDILLKAFTQAFSAADDVTLIIKDHTGDVFYDGLSLTNEIQALAANSRSPRIIYMDQYLSTSELAALYRSCDAAVFPYRAEGFGIPILESLACGIPVIVPNFGPCVDYCKPDFAWMMPVKRIALPIFKHMQFNTLGFTEEITEVDFCEVLVDTLAEFMLAAYKTPSDDLQAKGKRAASFVHHHYTWDALMPQFISKLEG